VNSLRYLLISASELGPDKGGLNDGDDCDDDDEDDDDNNNKNNNNVIFQMSVQRRIAKFETHFSYGFKMKYLKK
jgi:hypothetical protein